MNDRIQELLVEAHKQTKGGIYSGHPSEWSEKFAELIVRDCISQIAMIGVSNCENSDVGWTVDKSIENIRKHFGVE